MATAIFAGFVDAHAALHWPSDNATTSENVVNSLIATATAFVVIGLFHHLVAKRFKRTYMALHVFANIVISTLTLPASLRALANPTSSTIPTPGRQPDSLYICWVWALHVYHPIFFKTGKMDWVHHIPVYILNTLMFSVRHGDVIALQAFIMTGVPGGVDYLLQVLEGEGQLSRGLYKEYCASINMWVRAPFGAFSAYICLLGLAHGWDDASGWQRLVLFLMGMHAAWNPPFFCRQAVEANVVDIVNRFDLAGGALKLPKVRSLSGKTPKPAAEPRAAEAYPIGAADSAPAKEAEQLVAEPKKKSL